MSFVKFDFIYIYCLDTTIGQALGQVNAGINWTSTAVDVDVIASKYTTSLLFKTLFNNHLIWLYLVRCGLVIYNVPIVGTITFRISLATTKT